MDNDAHEALLDELGRAYMEAAVRTALREQGIEPRPNGKGDPQYIYVMHCMGNHKIGISVSPERRRTEIEWACGFDVEFVWQTSLPYGDAVEIEREAHRLLKAHRLKGEWFDTPLDECVKAINDAIDRILRRRKTRVRAEAENQF